MPILGSSASGAKSSPVAPTIGTATNVGTSRAYNNGSATVTFTAPTSKLPITSYTVTSSPGSFTASGASSPLTVTGLQSATAYTFTVTATSAAGTSSASSASNSITATTVPQAPTIGTATDAATGSAVSVTYTANATGGAAVSTFTATSSPSSITGTGASPITVSGLSAGTAYTFTVTATNANGTSTASSASNSVTPAIPKAGFFLGGQTESGVTTAVRKIVFATDTASTLAATVSAGVTTSGGLANSGTAGYTAMGNQDRTVDKHSFTTDTISQNAVLLPANRMYPGPFSNSGTAGYWAGGSTGTPAYNVYSSTISKVIFSNDAMTTLSATLNGQKVAAASFSNSGTAGYYAGGYAGGGTVEADKVAYSGDTRSTIGSYLASSRGERPAGFANSGTAAYIAGGYNYDSPSANSTMYKFTLPGDSRSTLAATLTNASYNLASASNNGVAGYISTGSGSPSGTISVDKLIYSTDTKSILSSKLAEKINGASGYANSGVL